MVASFAGMFRGLNLPVACVGLQADLTDLVATYLKLVAT
jgi:hypothetical protein